MKRKREDFWTVTIAVASICLGVFAALAKSWTAPETAALRDGREIITVSPTQGSILVEKAARAVDPGVFALLVGFATAIFGFTIRNWNTARNLEDQSTVIKNSIDRQVALTAFASKLSQNHEIILKAGLDTMMSQMASLVRTDQGFIINGTDWAMRSNTNFWREVKKYRSVVNGKNSFDIRVVHAGSPEIWKSEDALASLKAQKELSDSGGGREIKRIIVGDQEISALIECVRAAQNGASATNLQKNLGNARRYLELLRVMDEHNIDVFYTQGEANDFGSDFAMLNVGTEQEKRLIVMKWIHSSKSTEDARVAECHFIDWADEAFENRWYALKRRAKSYEDIIKAAKITESPKLPVAAE